MNVICAFLDYQIIDHLFRVATGTYAGKHKEPLLEFQARASCRQIDVWMSEITEVEMLMGRENPSVPVSKLPDLERKDAEKLLIAKNLGVRWLSYPCSKFDDVYSRLDVSFRFAGPESAVAEAFEQRIKSFENVSPGDARQLASLVYGKEDPNFFRPQIGWFVTQDETLRSALQNALRGGTLPELDSITIGSVSDLCEAA